MCCPAAMTTGKKEPLVPKVLYCRNRFLCTELKVNIIPKYSSRSEIKIILIIITFLQGENEKEKATGERTETPTSGSGTSQPQTSTPSQGNSTAGSPTGASPWGVHSMGVPPQYYAAYQSAYPYYATGYPMYNMMTANPSAAQGYASYAGPVTSHNTVSSSQAGSAPATNQNSSVNAGASGIRQRTAANQSFPTQNTQPASVAGGVPQTHSVVVNTQPRISQSGMFSLIFLWLLAVSIIALVCRRLFVVSWCSWKMLLWLLFSVLLRQLFYLFNERVLGLFHIT